MSGARERRRGARFNVSLAGAAVPLAVIAAIGALETARMEGAQREVFFNIRGFAIMLTKVLQPVSVLLWYQRD